MSPSNFQGDSLETCHIAIKITQQIYTNLDFVTWKNKPWLQNKTSILGFLVSYPPPPKKKTDTMTPSRSAHVFRLMFFFLESFPVGRLKFHLKVGRKKKTRPSWWNRYLAWVEWGIEIAGVYVNFSLGKMMSQQFFVWVISSWAIWEDDVCPVFCEEWDMAHVLSNTSALSTRLKQQHGGRPIILPIFDKVRFPTSPWDYFNIEEPTWPTTKSPPTKMLDIGFVQISETLETLNHGLWEASRSIFKDVLQGRPLRSL